MQFSQICYVFQVGEDGAQTSVPPNECNPIQPKRATTSVWPRNDSATRFSHDVRPRNDAATRFSHDVQLRNDTATHFSHDALVTFSSILQVCASDLIAVLSIDYVLTNMLSTSGWGRCDTLCNVEI